MEQRKPTFVVVICGLEFGPIHGCIGLSVVQRGPHGVSEPAGHDLSSDNANHQPTHVSSVALSEANRIIKNDRQEIPLVNILRNRRMCSYCKSFNTDRRPTNSCSIYYYASCCQSKVVTYGLACNSTNMTSSTRLHRPLSLVFVLRAIFISYLYSHIVPCSKKTWRQSDGT
jgi:hypothetical protein